MRKDRLHLMLHAGHRRLMAARSDHRLQSTGHTICLIACRYGGAVEWRAAKQCDEVMARIPLHSSVTVYHTRASNTLTSACLYRVLVQPYTSGMPVDVSHASMDRHSSLRTHSYTSLPRAEHMSDACSTPSTAQVAYCRRPRAVQNGRKRRARGAPSR